MQLSRVLVRWNAPRVLAIYRRVKQLRRSGNSDDNDDDDEPPRHC